MRTRSMRDWSNLPSELLELILQSLLFNFVDVTHFHAVCKSWRSVPTPKTPNPPLQLPWLMLSFDKTVSNIARFHSLSDGRAYSLPVTEDWGGWYSGSSRGWLFMIDALDSCYLLHPLTNETLLLPSVTKIFPQLYFKESDVRYMKAFRYIRANQGAFVSKVVLSSDPRSEECWVMLIIGRLSSGLAVCKLGGDSWTMLTGHSYDDITYFKGQFYAADRDGRVVACDLGGDSLVTKENEGPEPFRVEKTYLVELAGELLLVRRLRAWSFDLEMTYKTALFKVLQQDQLNAKKDVANNFVAK